MSIIYNDDDTDYEGNNELLNSGWLQFEDVTTVDANREFDRIQRERNDITNLPDYTDLNLVQWTERARPVVDGLPRDITFTPFWEDIYYDNANRMLILAARQVFKTTASTDILAHLLTTKKSKELFYLVDNETRLSAFSKVRMRNAFEQNDGLAKMVKDMNYGTIGTKLGTMLFMMTDQGGYGKTEGKSPITIVTDETQYQELEFINKLEGALSTTFGRMIFFGIGGEAGGPWHMKYQETDQREWVPKYNGSYKGTSGQEWRNRLKFWGKKDPITGRIINELEDGERRFGESNLIIGPYLRDVMDGRWIPTIQHHGDFHGYRIPQRMMFHIPLLEVDAEQLYGIHKRFSIEYKFKNWVKSIYETHVDVNFNKAMRRPITREMVLESMEPYSNMGLMTPQQVRAIKRKYHGEVTVNLGIDWGSGPSASLTVVAILLYWKKTGIYQVAYIEGRPREDQEFQEYHMTQLFKLYDCDQGVADLGYGLHKVKHMKFGNYNEGIKYDGVGEHRMLGCKTLGGLHPLQYLEDIENEEGYIEDQLKIGHTTVIDEFIDLFENKKIHPKYNGLDKGLRPKLIIPYKNPDAVDWLIKDFTATTRKDLAEIGDIETPIDPRESPTKKFNHPKDSVMAISYAMMASKIDSRSEWHWTSG